MATFRPKLGYSEWQVPATPTKYKLDWPKIGVWSGILVFCLAFYAVVIMGVAKLI